MTQYRQQIIEAMAKLDGADKDCPVRTSKRFLDICPRCKDTASDGCGLWDRAAVDFIAAVRGMVSE